MTYVLIMIAMMAIGFVLSYEISVEYLQMASLSTTLSQMGIDLSQLNLNWGTIVIALISLLLCICDLCSSVRSDRNLLQYNGAV